MARLPREFYNDDTVELAQALLGKLLVRRLDGEVLLCRILETEAYVGRSDKACHAYGGHRTPRTAPLFGPPGHAYIYLIYGVYHCLNFVPEPQGQPAAVLLRSLEPLSGAETISRLRYGKSLTDLTPYQRKNFLNGPGKLCKGLSLTRAENELDLTDDTLFLCTDSADAGLPGLSLPPKQFTRRCGKRIGIDYAEEAVDFPWRFWLEEEK